MPEFATYETETETYETEQEEEQEQKQTQKQKDLVPVPFELGTVYRGPKEFSINLIDIDENVVTVLCNNLRRGNTMKNACLMAGLNYEDFMNRARKALKKQKEIVACKDQKIQMLEDIEIDTVDPMDTGTAAARAVFLREYEKIEQEYQQQMQEFSKTHFWNYFVAYSKMRQAEAELENNLVETWYNLRHSDWKSARDLLARRFSKDWGEIKEKKHTFQGANGGPIQINSNSTSTSAVLVGHMDLSNLTDEELYSFESLLKKVPNPTDDYDGEMP